MPVTAVRAARRQGWLERTGRLGQTQGMLGPILIILALLVGLPVSFFATGAAISVLLGHKLTKEGEYLNEGSELIELNH